MNRAKSQSADLSYGEQRELANHKVIEELLGTKLMKLDKYNIMDWKEIQKADDETPPWLVEQKARKLNSVEIINNPRYWYNNIPTALIGKHKIDYMKAHGGTGIVIFDFTDKIMYWVFDDEEYKTFAVASEFCRGAREDVIDKPCAVVHIPMNILKEVEVNEDAFVPFN